VDKFEEDFPEIASDFVLPDELFPREQLFSSVLRVSSPRLQLWTHYDTMNNFLCQIVGHKDAVLFSPEEVPNLYLDGDKSMVRCMDGDDERFPLFRRAMQWRTRLDPGDVLFIPALWFHNMTADDLSIAVNLFYHELPSKMYDRRDVYGNRELIPAQRAVQSLDSALSNLRTLPNEYRSFYLLRSMERIKREIETIKLQQ